MILFHIIVSDGCIIYCGKKNICMKVMIVNGSPRKGNSGQMKLFIDKFYAVNSLLSESSKKFWEYWI